MSISSKMAKIMGWTEYPSNWKPDTNQDQALLVVEKLLQDYPTLCFTMEVRANKAVVWIVDYNYAINIGKRVEADTLALALCLAIADFN